MPDLLYSEEVTFQPFLGSDVLAFWAVLSALAVVLPMTNGKWFSSPLFAERTILKYSEPVALPIANVLRDHGVQVVVPLRVVINEAI